MARPRRGGLGSGRGRGGQSNGVQLSQRGVGTAPSGSSGSSIRGGRGGSRNSPPMAARPAPQQPNDGVVAPDLEYADTQPLQWGFNNNNTPDQPQRRDSGGTQYSRSAPRESLATDASGQPNVRFTNASYGNSLRRFDSPPASVYSDLSQLRHTAPYAMMSDSTLVNEPGPFDSVSQRGSDSTIGRGNRSAFDEKSVVGYAPSIAPSNAGSKYNNPGFLAVPELRQRQPSIAGSTADFVGGFGFDPNGRFSSAMSVASSDREVSSDAWVRRQRIKPGRAKTKKVKLTKGRFITEYDVPSAVRNANTAGGYGHMAEETEFTHMRYTAATCDPDDFLASKGYSLRPNIYGRRTELLIAMTYYNEPRELVARTLFGIQTNIRDMVASKWSEFQLSNKRDLEEGNGGDSGEASWKKVVVAIILDGIDPADKAVLDIFAAQGIYQDSIMKKDIGGVPTVCHIFEYTTQISISDKPQLIFPAKNKAEGLVPTQFILCIKAKNAKKINSHRWLFNALGRHLNPEVCVLIDAGTKPQPKSIYLLWEAFHHNKTLGGAAGEIHAMLGKWGRLLFNPLVAAQNFEYKMSNILDKPTESAFGYVSVLPGAFSAYRFRAIQGRPLEQYFHGDATMAIRMGDKYKQMSIFTKNMFLAEDRILCFELVAKAGEKWTLGYVKPSKAETDVPEAAAELIGQRRRWLNGSLAAGIYSLWHFGRVYLSGHGMIRLAMLHVQALLNFVTLFMGFFALANFYNTFSIIIDIIAENLRTPQLAGGGDPDSVHCWAGTVLEDRGSGFIHDHDVLGVVNTGLKMVYLALLALQVIMGLGNRPKAERFAYAASIWIFGLLALYLVVNTLYLTAMALCPMSIKIQDALDDGQSIFSVFTTGTFAPIAAGLIGTFGIWIIASIIYLDPWHFVQYLFITISFTNVLTVYSFCNLNDVSWGTKGSDKAESLASVQTKKDTEDAVVEVEEQTQASIDDRFKLTVMRAVSPFDTTEEEDKPTADDDNRTFRTRLVVLWLLVNAVLCIAIGRLPAVHRTLYFQVLLWVTFGLSVARFFGFLYYMIGESLFRTSRLTARMLR